MDNGQWTRIMDTYHKDPQERKLLWLADEDLDGEQRKAGCQRERRCLLCSGIS